MASVTYAHCELTHVMPAHAAAATLSDAGSGRAAVDASQLVQALDQKLSSKSPIGTAHVHAYTLTVMHSVLDTTSLRNNLRNVMQSMAATWCVTPRS